MRGAGQIAELAAIAEPDVGVITAHRPGPPRAAGLARGDRAREGGAARGMRDGGIAVVPAGEPLLEPYLREALEVVTFGPGGDVRFEGVAARRDRHVGARRRGADRARAAVRRRATTCATRSPRWPRRGRSACGPAGRVDVRFGALRGRARRARAAAPPSSTTATTPTRCPCAPPSTTSPCSEPAGRRVAVLGDMLELGPDRARAPRARSAPTRQPPGVDVLITVGPRSAAMLDRSAARRTRSPTRRRRPRWRARWSRPGDLVLVKASRGVGLEVVAEALAARRPGGG